MKMNKPDINRMRAILNEGNRPPGHFDPSVLQFGCEGCPSGHCYVTGWLSALQLVEALDIKEPIPRAFVSGNMSGVGNGEACPMRLDEASGEYAPDCQHETTVEAAYTRAYAIPQE